MSATVKSVHVKKPFVIEIRDVTLPEVKPSEVMIDVLACGICGFDVENARSLATDFKGIGHEVCGKVTQVGASVTHVKVGDQVALESSSFCGDCPTCRNGRVDLCNKAPNFWGGPALGFSDAMITPGRAVVPAPDIDPLTAALAEPCGVALDLCKTAEIRLTDRVLVVGTGAIGLMALAIARKMTVGPLVAANPSEGKLATAKKLGADHVVCLKKESLATCGEKFGGFDKVLITAPPQVIPDCLKNTAYGAYIVFIGSDFEGGGAIQLDTHALHFGKKQLRSSFASPAIYFPEALQLLRQGVVPASEIISHRFPLSRITEAFDLIRNDHGKVRKIMVMPDARFKG